MIHQRPQRAVATVEQAALRNPPQVIRHALKPRHLLLADVQILVEVRRSQRAPRLQRQGLTLDQHAEKVDGEANLVGNLGGQGAQRGPKLLTIGLFLGSAQRLDLLRRARARQRQRRLIGNGPQQILILTGELLRAPTRRHRQHAHQLIAKARGQQQPGPQLGRRAAQAFLGLQVQRLAATQDPGFLSCHPGQTRCAQLPLQGPPLPPLARLLQRHAAKV